MAPLVLLALLSGRRPARDPASERIVTSSNRSPAGTLKNGVLTLRLEARLGAWYPHADDGANLMVQAFAETGRPPQIPGPMIRVPEGTLLRITVRNTLDSTLVLYGLHTRPGSPDDTVQVGPRALRELKFPVGAPGTYYYWGSTTGRTMDDRDWLDSQLSGAFIVDPAGTPPDPSERIFVIGLWFQPPDSSAADTHSVRDVMTINGKSWPYTEHLTYTVGDSVHWRWINPSSSSHPMHLHGVYYEVDSRGSWAADTIYSPAARRLVVTELMQPGATMAVRWSPARPGNWIFHCHFAYHVSTYLYRAAHAEGAGHDAMTGMSGLVLGIEARPRPGQLSEPSSSERRHLRLLVQSAPHRFGSEPGFGFVLQRDGRAPAADSIEIPGTPLVLRRGEPVAITVVNHLAEPTAVHWHGIELESYPDGVPGWSGAPGHLLPPIAPGDSFTAEFTPPRSGTFIYHAHIDETRQLRAGLAGALIVLDSGQTLDPERDRTFLVSSAGSTTDPAGQSAPGLVNGSTDPSPLDLRVGVTYRLRLISIHPDWRVTFSLLSDTAIARWRPVAKDGAALPPAQATLRPAWLLTGPGETADFEFTPSTAGPMRLEVKTLLPGWYIPVPIRVHAAGVR